MEMDASSNTSNESQSDNNFPQHANMNYYTDNLFFATNGKLDSYFSNEKFRKTCDPKKFQYCSLNNNNNNVSKGMNNTKCAEDKRGVAMYNDNFKKSSNDAAKSGDFFSGNINNRVKSAENVVLKVDAFGKKAVTFSPDQVMT